MKNKLSGQTRQQKIDSSELRTKIFPYFLAILESGVTMCFSPSDWLDSN